jgi:hypothetical protein
MSSDYKYDAEVLAEELADQEGQDYYALSVNDKCAFYARALERVNERLVMAADLRNDEERDRND